MTKAVVKKYLTVVGGIHVIGNFVKLTLSHP